MIAGGETVWEVKWTVVEVAVSGDAFAFPSSMFLLWHSLRQKSRGNGHLLNWHIVHMFYAVTDFMMLNAVDLGWFVTLTLWYFVTP